MIKLDIWFITQPTKVIALVRAEGLALVAVQQPASTSVVYLWIICGFNEPKRQFELAILGEKPCYILHGPEPITMRMCLSLCVVCVRLTKSRNLQCT